MGPHTKELVASLSVAAVISLVAIRSEDWFGFDAVPWLIGFAVAVLMVGKVAEAVVRGREENRKRGEK